MAASINEECDCSDFLKFQEALKRMRMLDDRIIYSLNKSVPTQSFSGKVNSTSQCQVLYDQMVQAHQSRENAIKKCVNLATETVNKLKDERSKDMDNINLMKQLRKEQNKLHMMRAELNIEEIVKDRSYKAFHEKCGSLVKTPTAPVL